MFRIDGLPAHPLIVHAVVILLPLAAVGGLVIAARAAWRRRFGWVVLALTVAAVAAVPVAVRTGEQLQAALPPQNPLIQQHANLGDDLLPFAIAFLVAVVLLLVAGRRADAERAAAIGTATARADPTGLADAEPTGTDERTRTDEPTAGTRDRSHGATAVATRTPSTWRRLAIVASALVAFTGVAATVQVVRIGHSGSTAVWDGVGQN